MLVNHKFKKSNRIREDEDGDGDGDMMMVLIDDGSQSVPRCPCVGTLRTVDASTYKQSVWGGLAPNIMKCVYFVTWRLLGFDTFHV